MANKVQPLSVSNIHKKFKNNTILEDISFEVKQGEIFGLIGINGIGKTTLIKMILNLLSHDSGDITLFGKRSLKST